MAQRSSRRKLFPYLRKSGKLIRIATQIRGSHQQPSLKKPAKPRRGTTQTKMNHQQPRDEKTKTTGKTPKDEYQSCAN